MAEMATKLATNSREPMDSEASSASAPVVGCGSTELPSLRSEGERLELKRDNAQLRAGLAALTSTLAARSASLGRDTETHRILRIRRALEIVVCMSLLVGSNSLGCGGNTPIVNGPQ